MISSTTSLVSNRLSNISNENSNEEDQLNRINLQALQNRDPYITKIIDQAQRVCVYKFIAEKREWERKDLEGTLFVYERSCEPYHGFVILSTVSRETFVQIIKSSMEFKHSPNYEAFLQYKVDVGDIYGIWFISKNDCPRVTECLKRLTMTVKESDQSRNTSTNELLFSTITQSSSDIFSLLVNAQEKFQETKRKQEPDTMPSMPAALLRLFSIQDNPLQPTNNDEREQELKKTLGILGKPALSVTELEKQLLQPSSSEPTKSMITSTGNPNIVEILVKPIPISNKKDQDKFNAYAINTDDAWEIDDRTMTLKIFDKNDNDGDDDDDIGISKQKPEEITSKSTQQQKSNKVTNGNDHESVNRI
ncbi:unnamed protein product [Adineta steineri]|uniref:Uncharacterized protein n=1 Tax=Adineta steineri TaxID=433720 RepID=A0A814R439_9BILA|nr:unnamed protein product [Adineta steineri]